MIFSKMTTDLVITPIETMIEKVNNITKDPLKAAQDEEEKMLYQELAVEDQSQMEVQHKDGKKDDHKKEGPMETTMLEHTLGKIGALLALGFGEAGSKIIA